MNKQSVLIKQLRSRVAELEEHVKVLEPAFLSKHTPEPAESLSIPSTGDLKFSSLPPPSQSPSSPQNSISLNIPNNSFVNGSTNSPSSNKAVKVCSSCDLSLVRKRFSNTQWRKVHGRICVTCVALKNHKRVPSLSQDSEGRNAQTSPQSPSSSNSERSHSTTSCLQPNSLQCAALGGEQTEQRDSEGDQGVLCNVSCLQSLGPSSLQNE